MATETVENYLKAIRSLSEESPTGEATVTKIAAMVGVTTGTATTMIKKLVLTKLAKAERYGGVTLTAKGTKAALDVLRRHRLIETFLVQTLKFDWSEVHEEAERLEHALSPRLLDRLDEFLGRPILDPHGDPIPDATGNMCGSQALPLSDFKPSDSATIVRIADQDAAFLRFIAESRLKPGTSVKIFSVNTHADSIEIQPAGGATITLSLSAAKKVWADREI